MGPSFCGIRDYYSGKIGKNERMRGTKWEIRTIYNMKKMPKVWYFFIYIYIYIYAHILFSSFLVGCGPFLITLLKFSSLV